ncbi:MAG: calcium-translocating P-type ATPase, PMCA-type [Victivallaceae bacterium]|nr:calcium-translocating P-type ATPase, PMCA-type [Victivallaceae bacterium]
MFEIKGLTEKKAAESRRLNGRNELDPPPHKPGWRLLLEKLSEPLTVILGAAAVVSMLTGGVIEGCGILLAVVLSAGIGFASEYRAGREFDILNKTEDGVPVKTLRDGKLTPVPRAELALGDVMFVETGEEIPTDAEVLDATEFNVDQSKFTGEPEMVRKVRRDDKDFTTLSADASYPADNVLRGSGILSGSAWLRATAVGMATEIGRTARAATEITDETTPLQKQLTKLSKVIAVFGVALAVILFALLTLRGWSAGTLDKHLLLTFFMVAVTLIVVTVPEGLPMSVTLSLACAMRKMAGSNCLLRRLHAGETIGCATVICTDKTGTLTMNRMRVAALFFPAAAAELATEAMCVNSTASLDGDEVLGNPTEGALLLHLRDNGVDWNAVRRAAAVAKQWSFNTENKFMGTRLSSGRLHIKGAPEIIMAKCGAFLADGGPRPLDAKHSAAISRQVKSEQDKGNRTLAFAYIDDNSADPKAADGNMVWLGFVSISDPVRPEVPDAIAACRKAGISIKIVTGDTRATASEIGRQIGLADGKIIEGCDFAALGPVETVTAAHNLAIIARARPNDKLKLVKTLRASHEVVAVTGDGTNDAPALHHADVGVAMGKTGTAIAREAADVILLDDSFKSIVNAVLWGRSLYLNIQRFLIFQLTINAAAAAIALIGPFTGVAMPFTVIQMLWINLIMDTFAALALATEPPTPETMERPPRRPGTFIITGKMAAAIFGTAAVFVLGFLVMSRFCDGDRESNDRMLTIFFSGFVLLQLWNLMNVRAWGGYRSMLVDPPENPVFVWIVLGIAAMQILITQFGGALFRTVPLTLAEWLGITFVTSTIFFAGEIFRWLVRRRQPSTTPETPPTI